MPFSPFFNLLDIVSLNLYVIYKDISLSGQNRRQFSIKLGTDLCESERSRRHQMPHLLRIKRVRDGGDEDLPPGDEDLPPNKRTKCRICIPMKLKQSVKIALVRFIVHPQHNAQSMHQF